MIMDSRFMESLDPLDGFEFDDGTLVPSCEEPPNLINGFNYDPPGINLSHRPFAKPSLDPGNLAHSPSTSSETDSPTDHDSDPVLKFLNQILMEENIEDKPSMFYDPLTIQAAEKSFYDVLGEKYPPSPYRAAFPISDHNADSPESYFGSSSEHSSSSSNTGYNTVDSQTNVDQSNNSFFTAQSRPFDYSQTMSQSSFGSGNGQSDSFCQTNLFPNIFQDSESIMMFKKGMEEAKKFLPTNSQLIIDLDKYTLPLKMDKITPKVVVKVEEESRLPRNVLRGRKHHHREDSDIEEERMSKQSAVYVEEVELAEMFDRVLLCPDPTGELESSQVDTERDDHTLDENGQLSLRSRSKKQDAENEAVDLRTLLISCAQSVAVDDRRTANEQLKQIRHNASSTGDAYQRLAIIFANGLEARMAGTGTELYASLAPKRISAVEQLKAYQVFLSACPFLKLAIFYANTMIAEAASKAKTLHIIDFGILYGFQWPMLIQLLSRRPGGPPKVRITGIEHPMPGFRPAEMVEDTGRRLAKYCERFNVPFEYHAIATQNWETIRIEDLRITRNEVLAVNCLTGFKNLLDESVVTDSPRDAVLNLIRSTNPDIFIQTAANGSYSAPFFVTRFKEALFHYSAMFDVFEATIPRDNQQRVDFEQGFYGREAMNVIACEGLERVERPETFKQWHVRSMRAGFKSLPLERGVMKKLRKKSKPYHRDFVLDEDSHWMLQGWKGRILFASSCWVPA